MPAQDSDVSARLSLPQGPACLVDALGRTGSATSDAPAQNVALAMRYAAKVGLMPSARLWP